MRKIILNRAALDNGGRYCDAGTELVIGDKPNQIVSDRAGDLVARGAADGDAGAMAGASAD